MCKEKYKLFRDAFELAVLFVPFLFMYEWIETLYPFDADTHYRIAGSILPLSSALLSFCVLISENTKTALKKWLCSIPFTMVIWAVLFYTNFSIRLTNTLYTGYGRDSAGGGFAFMVTFLYFCAALSVGNLFAIALSTGLGSKMTKIRTILQNIILPAICALILLTVIYFEATMPTWETIVQSVYG